MEGNFNVVVEMDVSCGNGFFVFFFFYRGNYSAVKILICSANKKLCLYMYVYIYIYAYIHCPVCHPFGDTHCCRSPKNTLQPAW